MAKRTYLSGHKPAVLAKMRGMSAGLPGREGMGPPGIYEKAQSDIARVANGFPSGKDGQTDPLNKDAMSYYLRTITPPAYTGREPYTLGEGVSPEEWVRFYNFYKSDKNPLKEPEEWANVSTNSPAGGGLIKKLVKKGNPMAGRQVSMRDYLAWLLANPADGSTPDMPKPDEAPIIPGHEDAGSSPAPNPERSRAAIAKGLMEMFAAQQKRAGIKVPGPVGTDGKSTGDDDKARERMRRLLSARNAIKAKTSTGGSKYVPSDKYAEDVEEKNAKIAKAIEEKTLLKQMEEDERINALSDDELLNEFLKANAKPGEMSWDDSMKADEAAKKKSFKMPSWMMRARKAEEDGTSIQDIEQDLFGMSRKVKGKSKQHDSKEVKDELTFGRDRGKLDVQQYGGEAPKKTLTEGERAAWKAKGLSDAQIDRAIKAGIF
jgi:hypothetical protein